MRLLLTDLFSAVLVLTATFAISVPREAWAQDIDLSGIPPHPRLLLTPAVAAEMRMEAVSGPKVPMFAEIKRRADSYLEGPPATQMFRMVTLVVTGVAYDDTRYLVRAASDYAHTIQTVGWSPENDDYAYLYDWLYSYLTPAQRNLARTVGLAAHRLGGQRTVYYNLEANEAGNKGIVGLAFYGDGSGSDDEFCRKLVTEWDGRMRGVREFAFPGGSAASLGGVIPTRNHCFPDGGYYKGSQYTQKDMEGIVTYLLAFDQCGLGDYWTLARDYLEDWPEYMQWIRRPDNLASRMMTGSNYGWEKRGRFSMGAIATYLSNDVAQRWLHDQSWSSTGGSYDWGLLAITWRPSDPGPITLPHYKLYGANGETNVSGTSWSEKVFVRTGWNLDTDNDDVYFTFHAGDYFGDYFNFYQLGFEIYYRGALAIRSGYYKEGGHDKAYYGRAISNNCVVILDRTQAHAGDIWGQDWLYGNPGRPTHIYDVADNNVYDPADLTVFDVGMTESGRRFYYCKGMLKPESAYYYTNSTRRVAAQEREIVVDGHFFIVRDRVELSGGSNSVRWLLHTINEPILEFPQLLSTTVPGHIETFSRTRYSAERTEVVGARNYDGRITVAPVIPADATLRKVGGTGYETWVDDGEGNGGNWDLGDPAKYTDANEVGQWRVETIAPVGLSTDFVHAIWVGRPGQQMPEVIAIEDESSLGCEIDGIGVYVFVRTQEFEDGIDYQIQGSLEMPNIIEGLIPESLYTVRIGSTERSVWSDGSGGITFDGSGPADVRVSLAGVASR